MVGLFLFSLQTYIYNNTQRKAFWMKFTLKQNTRQNTYISLRFSFFFFHLKTKMHLSIWDSAVASQRLT